MVFICTKKKSNKQISRTPSSGVVFLVYPKKRHEPPEKHPNWVLKTTTSGFSCSFLFVLFVFFVVAIVVVGRPTSL